MPVCSETDHHDDLRDVQTAERFDLPMQKRRAADVNETLRLHGRAVQPCAFSCCKYDCFHEGMLSSFAEVLGTERRLNTSFNLLKYQPVHSG